MDKLGPYELNKIYCGDCLELVKEVPDLQQIFFVSDPPYNQKYHYDEYADDLPEEKYYELLFNVFWNKNAVIINYPEDTINLLGGLNLGRCEQCVSWVYNSNTAKQHRLITWWNCKPDFRKDSQKYKNKNDTRIIERMQRGESARLYDWWEINQVKNVSKEFDHPCPVPIVLMKRIIRITTSQDDIILDPFCGSGTTCVAAYELGRRFLGFEISQKYVDIANKRLDAVMRQERLFDN